jgi:hypothetical protein
MSWIDGGGGWSCLAAAATAHVVTVALPEGRELGADSPLGAGAEIGEEELRRFDR